MVGMNHIAAAAYGATQKLPTLAGEAGKADDGTTFADLVKAGLDEVVSTQKEAEQLSKDAVVGKADINDVILAVQNADMVLNTVIAIRDKVVTAYQDIIRMAV